jgi:hypothetical protein
MTAGVVFCMMTGSPRIAAAEPPASASVADGCNAPQQPMLENELIFGRNIGDRAGVSEGAWARFLAGEVTPRFPQGLTVINGSGQWRDRERARIVHEAVKIVIIITAADARAKIDAVIAAYKRRFHQQAVGVITRPVCAAFR